MKTWAMMLAGVLLLPQAAAAQPTRAQQDASVSALARVMTPADHAQLVAVLREAREQGLPVQPLIAKAQEGAAKQFPRIPGVVRNSMEFMLRAKALVGSPPANDV